MKGRYFLSRAAERDLDRIWDYSADRWDQAQADSYLRRIQAAMAGLCDFPETGRAVDDISPGYRVLSVEAHCIFYRTSTDAVEIVRILHGRMDPQGQFAMARNGS
ncbi:type II toxin-antitoxin system RelE/ParE family toxin [Maricaulis sp.]|uniref:type II toxin-antitoxin system RelE/ParE family toxin n=1 Tax=Maricaulis sp. TaxID=1486257 RepID=UPI003A9379E7